MLERWKKALEKNGLHCDLEVDTLQVEFPGPKYWVLRDQKGWNWFDANFREAVKNHVFGERIWFEPCNDTDWGLFRFPETESEILRSAVNGYETVEIGIGTDQNEAVGIATLLNKGTKYDAKSKALDQAIELAAIHKDSFKIVSEEWARTVDSVPELATELEGRK